MISSAPTIAERKSLSVLLYVIAGERLVCIDGAVAKLLRLERDDRCEWGLKLPLSASREDDTTFRASESVSDLWRRVVDVAFQPLYGRALFGEKGGEGRLVAVEPVGDRLDDYVPAAPPDMAWRVDIQVVFPETCALAMIVTGRGGNVTAELLEEEGGITPIREVSSEAFSAWVRGERR